MMTVVNTNIPIAPNEPSMYDQEGKAIIGCRVPANMQNKQHNSIDMNGLRVFLFIFFKQKTKKKINTRR